MSKGNIAILGATSHISKGLIFKFLENENYNNLYLFGRDLKKINFFLDNLKINYDKSKVFVFEFEEFLKYQYDVVINCVGFGDPNKLKDAGYQIFSITEKFDNLIIEYLFDNKETLYINFSSGAVFGSKFENSIASDTETNIATNDIKETNYYQIAKLNSEIKHRSLKNFNIVDIRVFSYFSRFIDLKSKFFMTDLVNALINKTKLITNSSDMFRDFVIQDDLFSLVLKCIEKKKLNDFFDLYSKKACSKFELLDFLVNKYGLEYEIEYSDKNNSPTGNKSNYFTTNFKAEKIGYCPFNTSIEGIEKEIKFL